MLPTLSPEAGNLYDVPLFIGIFDP